MRLIALALLLPAAALASPDPNGALRTPASADASLLEAAPRIAEPEGPPPPLAGVPIDFHCSATPPPGHTLYRRYAGRDLHDLLLEDGAGDPSAVRGRNGFDEELLGAWIERNLCTLIWNELAAAGAHATPADVRLPARAVLEVSLHEAMLSGSREVEQRVGSTVMPISVPHWALSLAWNVRFRIQYAGRNGAVEAPALDLDPVAGAEQEDYTPLRLGALLRAATLGSFEELPGILADEGRLGDLLFAVVDRPGEAPGPLGVGGTLSDSFWLLLSPSAKVRHDAMAFYLSSGLVDEAARSEMARWFLLHDSDLALRRDALAWLMSREAPADAEQDLSESTVQLLSWLLQHDSSPRMRAEAVHTLATRRDDDTRRLLLVAAADDDERVNDVALGLLRRFPPATAEELDALSLDSAPPQVAPWAIALDGRYPPPAGNPRESLLELALAAGGPAAETWLVRWLRGGQVLDADLEWALRAWTLLSAAQSRRVREEAIGRLDREEGRAGVDRILGARVATESEPDLRLLAIEGLHDGAEATDELIQATHDNDRRVRTAAARRLGEASAPAASARLEVLMRDDPDARVRRAARKALRQLSRRLSQRG